MPLSKKLQTTGKVTSKKYRCLRCGHERMESTNHYGKIYSACPNCSWKHPLEANVSECLDPLPEGWGRPADWTVVKLGDLLK